MFGGSDLALENQAVKSEHDAIIQLLDIRENDLLFFPLQSKVGFYNTIVPKEIWDRIKPYFLPDHHPIKASLDRLFQNSRVTLSPETFKKAGFGKPKFRKADNIIIGRNHKFKKYLFKVYLDTQPEVQEWENWISRIEGARSIQECLRRHGFHHHFKVPKKWVYPLPEEPSPPHELRYHRKNFILIVENMNILPGRQNLEAYKTKFTPALLNELYIILSEEGLIDSVYPDNIPFCRDGKIAFIDTEHHHLQPIKYEVLNPYFSLEMKEFWKQLTQQNH